MPIFEDPGELQPKDWPGGPPVVLDYLGRASRRIRDFLRTRLSLTTNIDCDVQTVRCTHGTEVRIKSRLLAPRGMSIISVGSGQRVESAKLIAAGSTARLTVYFESGAGSADVAVVLWPEGNASGSGLTYYPVLRPGQLAGSDGAVLVRDSTKPLGAKWGTAGGSRGALTNAFIVSPFRKGGFFRPVSTSNLWHNFGIQVPNSVAGALANVNLGAFLASQWGNLATTVGAVGGFSGPYNEAFPNWQPWMSATGILRSTAYRVRVWIGLASATLQTLAVLNGTSAASALKFVAIGWDQNVSNNIMLCSGDGTTYSCQDTGVPIPAGDPEANFIIDFTDAATLRASIQVAGGAVVSLGSKTTNMGMAGNTALGVHFTQTVINNGDNPTTYLSSLYLEQN